MSDSSSLSTSTVDAAGPTSDATTAVRRRSQGGFASGTLRSVVAIPDLGPLAAIIGAVLLGNSLFLLGFFNANPIYVTSGLGVINHGGIFPGTFPVDPNNGFTSQSLGHLAALDLLHGHLPWWNPFEGVGAPLAGEMQSAALFPGTILLALSNGQLYLHIILECIAGIATYRLLLRLDVHRWISAACGIAFAVNGTFAWFGHAPANPVAFLPLILLGVERARAAATDRFPQRWGVLSVGVALSLFAGFPEVAYLDGILAAAWIVIRLLGLRGEEVLAYIRKVALGLVTGLLLAAPIMVAFADYLRTATVASHSTGFNNAFLPHVTASSFLFPYSFGPSFGFVSADKTGLLTITWGNVGGYLTTSILVFALMGLYGRRLRSLRIVLAIWILLTIGRSFGIEPFARLFALIPAMNHIAAYRYLPPSWELAAITLAALGIDDIRRREVPMWFLGVCLAASTAIAVAVFVAGDDLRSGLAHAPNFQGWVTASVIWGFGMIAVIATGVLIFRSRARLVILLTCLTLDVLVMFVIPGFSAPRQVSLDTRPVVWLQHHLGTSRFYTLGPIAPNYGSYFDLPSADVNDNPIPKSYGNYIAHSLDGNDIPGLFIGSYVLHTSGPNPLEEFQTHLANYEAIGVKYLLASPGQVPAATVRSLHLRLMYSDSLVEIYRLPSYRAMYTVASGNCNLENASTGSIDADCKTRAVVVRRELYMAGWSAKANGRTVDIHKTGIFQSVVLEPGRSVVVFSYLPPHEEAAFVAFLVGLALLICGWWMGRGRRSPRGGGRHRRGPQSSRDSQRGELPLARPSGAQNGQPVVEGSSPRQE